MGEGADLPVAVLFACSRNAARSPMAAAILKHLAGRRVYVDSAGVRAGAPDPFAAAVMAEIGIDLSRHRPKSFGEFTDMSFDLIVSLSPEAHSQGAGAGARPCQSITIGKALPPLRWRRLTGIAGGLVLGKVLGRSIDHQALIHELILVVVRAPIVYSDLAKAIEIPLDKLPDTVHVRAPPVPLRIR